MQPVDRNLMSPVGSVVDWVGWGGWGRDGSGGGGEDGVRVGVGGGGVVVRVS